MSIRVVAETENRQIGALAQTYTTKREIQLYEISKRCLDFSLALLGLFLLLPVFLILVALVKLDSKGPVFFKQRRVGKGGQEFFIYKFRTMIPNAEQLLQENGELRERFKASGYKLHPCEDPRITKLGRILRTSSLDELPQLLNVVKGDMSLVGPRPILSHELVHYGDRVDELTSVRPGITGYWQVNGRSAVPYEQRVEMQLYYVQNASFFFDLAILMQTVSNLWTCRNNAY